MNKMRGEKNSKYLTHVKKKKRKKEENKKMKKERIIISPSSLVT
jgi:hypothetical protein